MNKNDQILIERCLKGDHAAFGELVEMYQERVYHFVYRLVDNAEDAMDVVQDAFIHAYQALHSFKGESQFTTWLHRIAYNAAVSLKRKRKVVISIDAARNGDIRLDPVDESCEAMPGYRVEQQEQHRRLQDALAKLSAEHRAVLIMKDLEGHKYETMSEILDVPIGTVRSRLHRARLELRDLLEREEI